MDASVTQKKVVDCFAEAREFLKAPHLGTASSFMNEQAEVFNTKWRSFEFTSWKDAGDLVDVLFPFRRYWEGNAQMLKARVEAEYQRVKATTKVRMAAGKKGNEAGKVTLYREFTWNFVQFCRGENPTTRRIQDYPKQKGMDLQKGRTFLKTLLIAMGHPGAESTLHHTLAKDRINIPEGLAYECLGILQKTLNG